MDLTRLAIIFCILLVCPVSALAYASVIASPQSESTVLQIENPEIPQEFFGQLDGFPHTFEFVVHEPFTFSSAVFAHESAAQKNDVSIILVKGVRRGVSEIGRTKINNVSWESVHDTMLVESFMSGGSLESELAPGDYRLEVSAPNNDGKYRLVLGTEKIKRGYFDNLQTLFEVKKLIGSPLWTIFLSPLVYIPFVLAMLFIVGFFVHKKVR